uniref:Uncharacterized protein n=1 Tax=Brassica campestris TaxID=3711 RepID=A0A3P5YZT6_BRACM|nr:unnamed protein product [Brassica rapa]
MLAMIRIDLSPAELICALRFRATKVADMNPATPAITHLKISTGTTERHCQRDKQVKRCQSLILSYSDRQKS